MNRSAIIALGIVGVLILVALALVLSNQTPDNLSLSTTSPVSSPQPGVGTTGPEVTPLPVLESVQGTVISVSAQPVEYKNSTLVTVRQAAGQTNLYITPQTRITDSANVPLALTAIRSGISVVAQGIPVEGGIEVTDIIVTAASPSPIISPSPAVSPTG